MPTFAPRYRTKVKGCAELGYRYTPQYTYRFFPFWFSWKTCNQGGGTDDVTFRTLEDAQKHIRDDIKSSADLKRVTIRYIPFIQ